MSGAHLFSNAHDIAVGGGTFYAVDTVSGTARYPSGKLIEWISGRCTSTTSTMTIGRRPMGSFPSCQTPAIGSQGAQTSSPKFKEHFSVNPNDSAQKRKYFLLYGMGGIGKTQICLKFIEDMSDQ